MIDWHRPPFEFNGRYLTVWQLGMEKHPERPNDGRAILVARETGERLMERDWVWDGEKGDYPYTEEKYFRRAVEVANDKLRDYYASIAAEGEGGVAIPDENPLDDYEVTVSNFFRTRLTTVKGLLEILE